MELELKHLAAYLPYGLRVQDEEGNNAKIVALFEDCCLIKYDVNVGDYEYDFDDIKPLLLPLSEVSDDLFKQIGFADEEDFIECVYNGDILQNNFNKLLSHHFDVFGLIDKGLAINKALNGK